MENVLAAD